MYMIIILGLQTILLPFILWLILLFFSGLFPCRNQHDETKMPLRFAIMICARNEETVIANILTSLQKQNYGPDCYQVFLVAHNCNDRTVEIARQYNVNILERIAPEEKSKGHALKYGISQLITNYSDAFDAVCFFDADNIPTSNFLKEINSVLSQGEAVVGQRLALNPHESCVTEMFAVHWMLVNRIHIAARHNLGFSCFVQGTGFAVPLACFQPNGWQTTTLTEDFEFSIKHALAGYRIRYVPEALFYDEQPVTCRDWYCQLQRWVYGAKQGICFVPEILRSCWSGHWRMLDLLWNTCGLPVSCSVFLLTTLVTILFLCLGQETKTVLTASSIGLLLSLFGIFLTGCVSIIFARCSPLRYLRGLLMYPLFSLMVIYLFIVTLFQQKGKWHAIKHKGNQKNKM